MRRRTRSASILDSVQKKIDESNAAVEAAKVKVNEWAESQKAAAQNKIAEWKAKGDAKSLQLRADIAEGYAKGHVRDRYISGRKGRKGLTRSIACSLRCGISKLARHKS